MKTNVFVLFILFGIVSFRVSGSNPIPSYNIPVYHIANFQEKPDRGNSKGSFKEKRNVHIKIISYGGPGCTCTIWVYSLDGRDVIGPDTMGCNDERSYEIDERDWGVVVECDEHVDVDVWIEAAKGGSPTGDATLPENGRMGHSPDAALLNNTFCFHLN